LLSKCPPDNPVNHFPVYEPSAERVAEIAAAHSEANNPLEVHYDASREVRAKGAAFYQLSADEETRKRQMEELKSARQETEKTRQETGAVDVKAGEIEGMQEGASTGGKSRAAEKRKRELEERRRLVDAKRKKAKSGGDASLPSDAVEPRADVACAVPDPFAALELQSSSKTPTIVNDADAFLASLEREMLIGKRT